MGGWGNLGPPLLQIGPLLWQQHQRSPACFLPPASSACRVRSEDTAAGPLHQRVASSRDQGGRATHWLLPAVPVEAKVDLPVLAPPTSSWPAAILGEQRVCLATGQVLLGLSLPMQPPSLRLQASARVGPCFSHWSSGTASALLCFGPSLKGEMGPHPGLLSSLFALLVSVLWD